MVRKFQPGKPMILFVIFFFPTLLYLGYWQINRGMEKKEIIELYDANRSYTPIFETEVEGTSSSI